MCKMALSVAFCLCLYLLHSVYAGGSCTIRIPDKNPPIYLQKFGSEIFLLPFASSPMFLDEGEIIHGYCSTQFSYYNYGNDYKSAQDLQWIYLTCSNGELIVKLSSEIKRYSRLYDNSVPLACVGRTWSLFETKKKLSNCDEFWSYAFGAKTTENPIILAGLCYDMDKLLLKYVNYVAQRKKTDFCNQQTIYPEEMNTLSLAEPLGSFNNLLRALDETTFEKEFSAKTSTNFWLQFAKYRYNSLVQSRRFRSEFNQFYKVFDTIWWDNLRLGNWKQLTDILDERSISMTYSVFIGTSGAVRVPNQSGSSDTLVIDVSGSQLFSIRRTIPEYIWLYLRLQSHNAINPSDEFVVIGHNSPYFEYFNINETIFCTDICDQIDWLAPIKKTRMVSTLGVVFCCRPEDVEHRLDGFPKNRHGLSSVSGNEIDNCSMNFDKYQPKSSEESNNLN